MMLMGKDSMLQVSSEPVPEDPEKRGAADGTGNAALQVLDGAVYLPEGRLIASGSEEFQQLLQRNLPSEIAPDVIAQWRGISGRMTRFQWLGSIFLLLAAAGFLYVCFPKVRQQELQPQNAMEIVSLSRRLRSSSPYRGDYERAREAHERGNYHEVAQILRTGVENIIRTADRDSDPVLFLYFDALLHLSGAENGNAGAADQLRVLRDSDPDNPVWAQFAFELEPRIRRMRDYSAVRRSLRDPAYRNALRTHLYAADYALKQLRILRRLVNPAKFPKDKLEQYRENFDLFEVQLLLSRWLLLGTGAGKSTLPDNRDDPGVADREKALRIALKHETAACEDFWQARRFIAETLCDEDSVFNHIYWNGGYLKTKDRLIREIEICNQRLNRKEMP